FYLKYATEAGMKLAVVTGQIVCTVRHHGLAHDKLLMVEMIDPHGNPDGQCAVAIDNIGAGTGEWVLLVSGSSATPGCKQEPPASHKSVMPCPSICRATMSAIF